MCQENMFSNKESCLLIQVDALSHASGYNIPLDTLGINGLIFSLISFIVTYSHANIISVCLFCLE